MRTPPVATVIAYRPPTKLQATASVTVRCPLGCVERDRWRRPVLDDQGQPIPLEHVHGIGAAGGRPVLGSRVAHCRQGRGGVYTLTDEHNLVPGVLEIAQGVTT